MSDRWGRQPAGFNRTAAEAVYKALTSMDPDEAHLLGTMFVEATIQPDLIRYGSAIAKVHDAMAREQAEVLRKRLSREVLAKRRIGDDATEQLRALTALLRSPLAKADDYKRDEHGRFSERDLRNGHYARDHAQIGFDSSTRALEPKHAAQFGIPEAGHLKGADQQRYQQAYGQLHNLVAPFTGMPDSAVAHLHIRNSKGGERTMLTGVPGKGSAINLGAHLGPDEHLHAATISVVPPTTASGAAYDALAGAGMPGLGGYAYNAVENGAGSPERLAAYRKDQDRRFEQDEHIPSQRVFRNLESGSKLLSDSLGPNAPRGAKYALAVGEHVGRFGPEAQKVIGPTADKAAYRFRGTERPVSRNLGMALESIRRNPKLGSGADRREYLLHGTEDEDGWKPSGVLDYFRRQLPSVDLNTLQLKSGTVPPSKGIVVNSKGQVQTESVGYGDDHYLPFNLRGLTKRGLKGGEYIRTRTYGGPTTEDIAAGLLSGARGLTVVSHNGVYTVDFNDSLRGGRRHNDKSARMVARYGHLLDAVQSQQVTTGGIDPTRMDELEAEAAKRFDPERNEDGFKTELDRLKRRQMKNPVLSRAQTAQATLDFFNDQALLMPTDGQVLNADDLIQAYRLTQANKVYADAVKSAREYGQPVPTLESVQAMTARYATHATDTDPVVVGQKVAEAMGKGRQLDKALADATAANKAAITPLRLNGEGYKTALDALAEQFPYEIDRVEFHPWEGQRRTATRGQTDTGYVRPRHSRAAEALSGYFDAGITGAGKVYADSTRGQNHNWKTRAFVAPAERAAQKQGAAASSGGASPLSPADAAVLQDQADRGFHAAVSGAVGIGAGAAGTLAQARGWPMSQFLQDAAARGELQNQAPDLLNLHQMTPDAYDRAATADPAGHRAMLKRARQQLHATKALDVPAPVLEAFDSNGAPRPKRTPAARASDDLNNLEQDFDMPGLPDAFQASAAPNTQAVEDAYRTDPDILRLVQAGTLPSAITHPNFDTELGMRIADRVKTKADIVGRRASGERVPEEEQDRLDEQVEGLRKAKQLQRRHKAAVRRETAPATQAPAGPAGDQVTNMMAIIGDPSDLSEDQLNGLKLIGGHLGLGNS